MKRKDTVSESALEALRRGAEDRLANRPGDAWPTFAYLWGRENGIGAHPEFIAALLELPRGTALARRAATATQRLPSGIVLPQPGAEGVETLESLAESWEALQVAREIDSALRKSLNQIVVRADLGSHLPRFLALLARVLAGGVALCPLRETVRRLAQAFQDLPAPLVGPLLGLLEERWWSLWGRPCLPRRSRQAHGWESRRWDESVEPVVRCLRKTKDLRLTLRLESLHALEDVPKGRANARRYAMLLQLLPPNRRPVLAKPIAFTLTKVGDPSGAARGLTRLYQAFGSDDAALTELVELTQSWRWNPEFGAALPVLLPLLRGTPKPSVEAFCALLREVADTPDELEVASALAPSYFSRHSESAQNVDLGVRLAASLAFDDPKLAATLYDVLTEPTLEALAYETLDGARVLREYPGVRKTAAHALLARPKATLALLPEFSSAANLPRAERDALGATRACAPNRSAWEAVRRAHPDADAAMYEYAALGISTPPPGVCRAAQLPEKLRREAEYLRGNPKAAVRHANLVARLEDVDRLAASVGREVAERLGDGLAEARLSSLRQSLDGLWAHRLEILFREPVATATGDLLHAARFSASAGVNRRPLARLLRADDALESHPNNVAFARKMVALGFCWEQWMAERRFTVSFAGAGGEVLTLYATRDSMRVLQMGTLFSTCLAADGCNAFSAVANAVDVNKRVVFAEDGRGKIVARQLLALTDDAGLLGFNVYNHLPPERQQAVRALFRAWGAALAVDCGATLVTNGEVSKLVSRAWYDDGAVAWWPKESAVA